MLYWYGRQNFLLVLHFALLEGELASKLLAALREQDLLELAAEIAPDWDLPAETVQSGLCLLYTSNCGTFWQVLPPMCWRVM